MCGLCLRVLGPTQAQETGSQESQSSLNLSRFFWIPLQPTDPVTQPEQIELYHALQHLKLNGVGKVFFQGGSVSLSPLSCPRLCRSPQSD